LQSRCRSSDFHGRPRQSARWLCLQRGTRRHLRIRFPCPTLGFEPSPKGSNILIELSQCRRVSRLNSRAVSGSALQLVTGRINVGRAVRCRSVLREQGQLLQDVRRNIWLTLTSLLDSYT
jgi:hypothetical protein